MVGIALLARPIIGVLFERGAFDATAVAATADALVAFGLGLPAFVLIKVLAPGFFAREDTRTPVLVAAGSLALNLLLNLVLMPRLAHVGIALATAVAGWVNAGLLAVLLARRGGLAIDARLRRRLPGLVGALVVMALALLFARRGLGGLLAAGGAWRAGALAGLIAGGAVLFVVLAHRLGALDMAELWRALRRGAPAR
ncbi:MAG: lipid II flippase MurJ [Pseudomonadota bacterium]